MPFSVFAKALFSLLSSKPYKYRNLIGICKSFHKKIAENPQKIAKMPQ
jgi:hypothetical protein